MVLLEHGIDVGEHGAPKVRFTQRERRGVFLGLTWLQIFVIGGVVAALLFTIIFFIKAFLLVALPGIVVAGVGAGRWRRESVLVILVQWTRYFTRVVTGQTRFRRNVWARVGFTRLATGEPIEMVPVPEVVSKHALPGALGDVQLVSIPTKGAFMYNAAEGLASLTVTVSSTAWPLRDASAQEVAYNGFVDWLTGLEHTPGLVEAVMRIRVDQSSSTELKDYIDARDAVRTTQHSDALDREYAALIAGASKRSMTFTNLVTIVLRTSTLDRSIRDSGGGLVGLGAILTDMVEALKTPMEQSQAVVDEWLDADHLEAAMSTALDPIAAAISKERNGVGRRALRGRPPVMSADEYYDCVRIGQSWHQTFWVAEWPRAEVRTGFLEKLMYAGNATRVITLRVRPTPIHKAISQVDSALGDLDIAEGIRTRMRSRISTHQRREKSDLEKREEDLADGFGDVKFRGFVTVSADTRDALSRARTEIEQASFSSRLTLAVMYGQQAAAFVTSALPVPIGGK